MILEILRVNFGILTSLLSLCILSYMDLRRKEVSLWMLLIYGITTVIFLFCPFFTKADNNNKHIIINLIFTLLLILMSVLFKCIAVADAVTLCLVTLSNSLIIGLASFFIAMLMAAVFSLVGLGLKKLKRKATIPFIPFLLAAYLAVTIAYY